MMRSPLKKSFPQDCILITGSRVIWLHNPDARKHNKHIIPSVVIVDGTRSPSPCWESPIYKTLVRTLVANPSAPRVRLTTTWACTRVSLCTLMYFYVNLILQLDYASEEFEYHALTMYVCMHV